MNGRVCCSRPVQTRQDCTPPPSESHLYFSGIPHVFITPLSLKAIFKIFNLLAIIDSRFAMKIEGSRHSRSLSIVFSTFRSSRMCITDKNSLGSFPQTLEHYAFRTRLLLETSNVQYIMTCVVNIEFGSCSCNMSCMDKFLSYPAQYSRIRISVLPIVVYPL